MEEKRRGTTDAGCQTLLGKASAQKLDASGEAGSDGEGRGCGFEIGGLEAFADGEESVGAGEAVTENAGGDGKAQIAPGAAAKVTEDEPAMAKTVSVGEHLDDVCVGQMVEKVVGEEIVKRGECIQVEGVGMADVESGDLLMLLDCVLHDAGIGVHGGDAEIETLAAGGGQQPDGDVAGAGTEVDKMVGLTGLHIGEDGMFEEAAGAAEEAVDVMELTQGAVQLVGIAIRSVHFLFPGCAMLKA